MRVLFRSDRKALPMIDLKAKREANKKRLLGISEVDGKVVIPYTTADVLDDAAKCWEIISIVIRKKTNKGTDKNGKPYTRPSKELAFPDLITEEVVGERATSKQAKSNTVTRTNYKTMEEMYGIRNAMVRHYADDTNDNYIEYFGSVVEVLDGYAQQVVADMVDADSSFLDKVNKARGCK